MERKGIIDKNSIRRRFYSQMWNMLVFHPKISKAVKVSQWDVEKMIKLAEKTFKKSDMRKQRVSFVTRNPLGRWGERNQILVRIWRDDVRIDKGYKLDMYPDFKIPLLTRKKYTIEHLEKEMKRLY